MSVLAEEVLHNVATPSVKESKAQRAERLKVEKNPWEAWAEVRQFALEGRESVLASWTGLYFKWWGIYTQGDGVGAIGGVGGEGKESEYFMMRIGVPNGILSARQLRVIGELTVKHARGIADVTTRQAIQLHWLTIESLPEIVEALEAVGLGPKGACGDVVRNVTGCPLAGKDGHELIDSSGLALEVAQHLTGNLLYYNLPRKFKISITGCPVWCSYPEINDVGLTGIERVMNGVREVGYSLRVGGGLSAEPHLAVRLNGFVRPEQALRAIEGVVEIFREQENLRKDRKKARLKYLFLSEEWTAESFLTALEAKVGFKFDAAPDEEAPEDVYRDHVGVHRQKQDGLSYVGVSVLRGRLSGEQLLALADLAEEFGVGEGALRTTVGQNVVVVDVPNERVQELCGRLAAIGLEVQASMFWRGTVACTGTEFCKLAITETKGFARWVVGELEERLPEFREPLRLNVTGCPNGCGQHWIADIGLEGKKVKHNGALTDAYNFNLGGAVGLHSHVARVTGYRCVAEEVPVAIERLLRAYLAGRVEGEGLRGYLARFDVPALRAQLAGGA